MSEYWVSQPKFYCKFCNCHIADNKPSIQFHENGVKHKQKVEEFSKQQREQKLHGARSEQDLQRQLAEIDRAARAALVSDISQSDSTFFSNSGYGNAPPPPAPRPPEFPPGFVPREEQVIEEENSGIYSIRGRTYLDGKIFENKINVGVKCEIFLETIDEWVNGEITRRMETEVPNTKVTIKSFDVSYSVPVPDTDTTQVVNERRVKSDRIRLLINEDTGDVLLEEPHRPREPLLNENTGLGVWQTVSVRTVDEEKEWAEHQAAREAMSLDHNLSGVFSKDSVKSKKPPRVEDDTSHLDVDSAMGAYDPYNTGIYKGVKIRDEKREVDKFNSLTYGEIVQFKKRRVEVKKEEDGSTEYTASESKITASEDQLQQTTSSTSDGPLTVGVVVRKVGGARNFRRKQLDD